VPGGEIRPTALSDLRILSPVKIGEEPVKATLRLGPDPWSSWLAFFRPAIGRDNTIHAQVFHELTLVIKTMSDRVHGERKTRLLPLTRTGRCLHHILFVDGGNSLVQSRE